MPPNNTVFIRDTIIKVAPPLIIDSAVAVIKTDTLIKFIKLKEKDTIAKIEYYPAEAKIKYLIKPDTIAIMKRDTVTVYSAQPPPSYTEKNKGVIITALIFGITAIVALVIFFLKLRK